MKKTFIITGIAALVLGVTMGFLFGSKEKQAKYKPGDRMGRYSLLADTGKEVELPINKWTVLYFYPKDDTPGCTTQAKTFTALYDEYAKADIAVFGISTDGIESHKKFKEKHQLKVTLLSDPKGELAGQFGVTVMLGMCSRDAIILNPSGEVDTIHRGVSPKASPYEIIEYIITKQG